MDRKIRALLLSFAVGFVALASWPAIAVLRSVYGEFRFGPYENVAAWDLATTALFGTPAILLGFATRRFGNRLAGWSLFGFCLLCLATVIFGAPLCKIVPDG